MAPAAPNTPRRPASTRVRSTRPKSTAPLQAEKSTPAHPASEPPHKKRRYIPGGPGGGGRYVDDSGNEIPVGGTGPGGYNYVGPRGRIGRQNAAMGLVPQVYDRRDRSARTRTVMPRSQQPAMRFSSAAQAAAVVQSDGYKPREERAWEEFHPELDIEAPLRAFSCHEVEGTVDPRPVTPVAQSAESSVNGSHTPNGIDAKSEECPTPSGSLNDEVQGVTIPGTPGGAKRRPGRPPKNPVEFYKARAAASGTVSNVSIPAAPKMTTPVVASIHNFTAKERLTLPQPSYRKTDTLARFEDRTLGLVNYVNKSMASVGYQESDIFFRPERTLIKVSDGNLDEEMDMGPGDKSNGDVLAFTSGGVGRVEYDMDEQDDKWLIAYNAERKAQSFETITREVFEITITKIEKEWHALEKRIPKPNPKPPQTHRPRSSSAAAVNGEPQAGEEQDSKCAICDDGDCENTNAIVFCDGCDLAVHQECYGVPFIPEGQWLCRKCQLIGRGIPTCIFCPNTDGAFKQTNASKWAHLLCAMWIPEVSLGNHTFMEPVMEVEKVPRTRWKLTCYLCNQRMGACIQCGNRSCYQAFHVTCARRARLFLKMKNNHGTLAVLDGTTHLKAFCDKHGPSDYTKENDVARAARNAKSFYKKSMRGRLWADSQASALAMAATHRHAVTEHQPDESQLTGAKVALITGDKKKGNLPQKPVWKLPSGAPVIPKYCYDNIEKSLARFNIHKRKEYTADLCRYWTLKREARRGAALLKRLQLQMETFSSMEITRRNFAGMGSTGRARLERRIEFAKTLVLDLEKLKGLASATVKREQEKLHSAELEEEMVDTVYFPIAKFLPYVVERALALDIKRVFTADLKDLRKKLEERFYTSAMTFVHHLCDIFHHGIYTDPPVREGEEPEQPGSKKAIADMKARRTLGKRILKSVQPKLIEAISAEADLGKQPPDRAVKELDLLLTACWETGPDAGSISLGDSGSVGDDADGDVVMAEATSEVPKEAEINGELAFKEDTEHEPSAESADIEMADIAAHGEDVEDSIVADHPGESEDTINTDIVAAADDKEHVSPSKAGQVNGIKNTNTPPGTNGYISAPDIAQTSPLTPPVSNGDSTTDPAEVLRTGGVPWYFADFKPEGTSIVQPGAVAPSVGDDLSEMNDADLEELNADINGQFNTLAPVVTASPSKKKAKAKKRSGGRRR